ncbi:hypothetical protein BJV78DRAFT_1360932 [Lactifluus subvellereus]|nr:hypothetical protein BJV78DRAFT_1360932 [Lactifluus subvellereus]
MLASQYIASHSIATPACSNYKLRSNILQSETQSRQLILLPRHPPRSLHSHRHHLPAPISTKCSHHPNFPTKASPLPRVVRLVQAVVEVPVKEEGFELDGERPPDAPVLHPASTPTGGGAVRRRNSSAGSHHRSEVVPRTTLAGPEGEEAPSNDAGGREYMDEEDVENPPGTLAACGKTVPRSAQASVPVDAKKPKGSGRIETESS